jgi:thiol-disulfide isomerase/thioredoxin
MSYQPPVLQMNLSESIEFIANNDEVNIIIEFYASWCKKCVTIKPFIENLSRELHRVRTKIVL